MKFLTLTSFMIMAALFFLAPAQAEVVNTGGTGAPLVIDENQTIDEALEEKEEKEKEAWEKLNEIEAQASTPKTTATTQSETDLKDQSDFVPENEDRKRKTRQVLNPRSTVNGIQGRWMPKKVWENDVDNDKARTILQNSNY